MNKIISLSQLEKNEKTKKKTHTHKHTLPLTHTNPSRQVMWDNLKDNELYFLFNQDKKTYTRNLLFTGIGGLLYIDQSLFIEAQIPTLFTLSSCNFNLFPLNTMKPFLVDTLSVPTSYIYKMLHQALEQTGGHTSGLSHIAIQEWLYNTYSRGSLLILAHSLYFFFIFNRRYLNHFCYILYLNVFWLSFIKVVFRINMIRSLSSFELSTSYHRSFQEEVVELVVSKHIQCEK